MQNTSTTATKRTARRKLFLALLGGCLALTLQSCGTSPTDDVADDVEAETSQAASPTAIGPTSQETAAETLTVEPPTSSSSTTEPASATTEPASSTTESIPATTQPTPTTTQPTPTTTQPAPTTTGPSTSEPPTTAEPVVLDVAITDAGNLHFDPAFPQIQVGQTVRWTNTGSVIHSSASPLWNSHEIAVGDTFSFTFDSPGRYYYRCNEHGGRARIDVLP